MKNWYQILTHVKNWYQIITDVKNWYSIFTNVNDRNCNIQSHMEDSSYMPCGCKLLDDYISIYLYLSHTRAAREREREREIERERILKKYDRFKYVLETAYYVDQRGIA